MFKQRKIPTQEILFLVGLFLAKIINGCKFVNKNSKLFMLNKKWWFVEIVIFYTEYTIATLQEGNVLMKCYKSASANIG